MTGYITDAIQDNAQAVATSAAAQWCESLERLLFRALVDHFNERRIQIPDTIDGWSSLINDNDLVLEHHANGDIFLAHSSGQKIAKLTVSIEVV